MICQILASLQRHKGAKNILKQDSYYQNAKSCSEMSFYGQVQKNLLVQNHFGPKFWTYIIGQGIRLLLTALGGHSQTK